MGRYNRTLDELRSYAILHWPKELLQELSRVSPLHRLLDTQDKFLGLLKIAGKHPMAWQELLSSSDLPGNLFLKHLMILADLGGEALNKLTPLEKDFPGGVMQYVWGDKTYEHRFSVFGRASLTNSALHVDGDSLLNPQPLTAKMEDIVVLLLFAGASINAGPKFSEEVRSKAFIGNLLGKTLELDSYVRQHYLRISRQITGADANTLGQIAQNHVLQNLKSHLGEEWTFQRDGSVPGISHAGGNSETTFDIVATSPKGKFFAIEVSFQVTTNSVIERKAGQARSRYQLLDKHKHHICYVIDGAGNINVRTAAVNVICQYSHCTVAFSEAEMAVLADHLRLNG